MKKVLFPILALVLALGLVLPAVAHTEDAPLEVTLWAGQNMDVGDVTVWNDSSNLYVKYQTTGGWEMTETHLHVATSLDGIPQKNGNPPPGKFDYSSEHACVTEYTYTIPLSWSPCTNLYIAAHAEVQKLGNVMTASIVTGAGTDNVLVIAEDSFKSNYPTGYPGPYSSTPTPSVVIQDTPNGYSDWPTITGARWISDDSITEPPNVNEWRLFTRNFSLPSNATNISGMLHIDSDNAEEAKINGFPATGLVYGEVYGNFNDDGEWRQVQHWPVGSYLQPGANTLEVMVRNYYWLNMPGDWRNYTGLVYKMDYKYQLLTTETAWGDGIDFPGKNWATYFTYHVQGLVGDWQLDFDHQGTHYVHDMTIATQDGSGNLTGTGGWPAGSGPPYNYPYNWTLTGNISGSTVNFTILYQNGYAASLNGTVTADLENMSGNWSDSSSQSGTWTATRGP